MGIPFLHSLLDDSDKAKTTLKEHLRLTANPSNGESPKKESNVKESSESLMWPLPVDVSNISYSIMEHKFKKGNELIKLGRCPHLIEKFILSFIDFLSKDNFHPIFVTDGLRPKSKMNSDPRIDKSNDTYSLCEDGKYKSPESGSTSRAIVGEPASEDPPPSSSKPIKLGQGPSDEDLNQLASLKNGMPHLIRIIIWHLSTKEQLFPKKLTFVNSAVEADDLLTELSLDFGIPVLSGDTDFLIRGEGFIPMSSILQKVVLDENEQFNFNASSILDMDCYSTKKVFSQELSRKTPWIPLFLGSDHGPPDPLVIESTIGLILKQVVESVKNKHTTSTCKSTDDSIEETILHVIDLTRQKITNIKTDTKKKLKEKQSEARKRGFGVALTYLEGKPNGEIKTDTQGNNESAKTPLGEAIKLISNKIIMLLVESHMESFKKELGSLVRNKYCGAIKAAEINNQPCKYVKAAIEPSIEEGVLAGINWLKHELCSSIKPEEIADAIYREIMHQTDVSRKSGCEAMTRELGVAIRDTVDEMVDDIIGLGQLGDHLKNAKECYDAPDGDYVKAKPKARYGRKHPGFNLDYLSIILHRLPYFSSNYGGLEKDKLSADSRSENIIIVDDNHRQNISNHLSGLLGHKIMDRILAGRRSDPLKMNKEQQTKKIREGHCNDCLQLQFLRPEQSIPRDINLELTSSICIYYSALKLYIRSLFDNSRYSTLEIMKKVHKLWLTEIQMLKAQLIIALKTQSGSINFQRNGSISEIDFDRRITAIEHFVREGNPLSYVCDNVSRNEHRRILFAVIYVCDFMIETVALSVCVVLGLYGYQQSARVEAVKSGLNETLTNITYALAKVSYVFQQQFTFKYNRSVHSQIWTLQFKISSGNLLQWIDEKDYQAMYSEVSAVSMDQNKAPSIVMSNVSNRSLASNDKCKTCVFIRNNIPREKTHMLWAPNNSDNGDGPTIWDPTRLSRFLSYLVWSINEFFPVTHVEMHQFHADSEKRIVYNIFNRSCMSIGDYDSMKKNEIYSKTIENRKFFSALGNNDKELGVASCLERNWKELDEMSWERTNANCKDMNFSTQDRDILNNSLRDMESEWFMMSVPKDRQTHPDYPANMLCYTLINFLLQNQGQTIDRIHLAFIIMPYLNNISLLKIKNRLVKLKLRQKEDGQLSIRFSSNPYAHEKIITHPDAKSVLSIYNMVILICLMRGNSTDNTLTLKSFLKEVNLTGPVLNSAVALLENPDWLKLSDGDYQSDLDVVLTWCLRNVEREFIDGRITRIGRLSRGGFINNHFPDLISTYQSLNLNQEHNVLNDESKPDCPSNVTIISDFDRLYKSILTSESPLSDQVKSSFNKITTRMLNFPTIEENLSISRQALSLMSTNKDTINMTDCSKELLRPFLSSLAEYVLGIKDMGSKNHQFSFDQYYLGLQYALDIPVDQRDRRDKERLITGLSLASATLSSWMDIHSALVGRWRALNRTNAQPTSWVARRLIHFMSKWSF
ncbi:hypothetical protein H696_02547 [Fonticula alba]|uniref:Asteroid domain-containing protein n=1 Tax=Fonticula alba TaxID=691883 RepID=A0A058Z7W3_FONAL|nr:hypothetical protein H696_02547 [Fonticula alba]KCV70211.1 hypothetical protein H696_02547 [Fonticula alba]|eukprot:XP_009494727.1 hypothetical protein H696_02547 [Fonticula alba]